MAQVRQLCCKLSQINFSISYNKVGKEEQWAFLFLFLLLSDTHVLCRCFFLAELVFVQLMVRPLVLHGITCYTSRFIDVLQSMMLFSVLLYDVLP